MKLLKKFVNIDNGKLFAQILALIIIFTLIMFTPIQKIDFALKIFILIGVIWVSVQIMKMIKQHLNSKEVAQNG